MFLTDTLTWLTLAVNTGSLGWFFAVLNPKKLSKMGKSYTCGLCRTTAGRPKGVVRSTVQRQQRARRAIGLFPLVLWALWATGIEPVATESASPVRNNQRTFETRVCSPLESPLLSPAMKAWSGAHCVRCVLWLVVAFTPEAAQDFDGAAWMPTTADGEPAFSDCLDVKRIAFSLSLIHI